MLITRPARIASRGRYCDGIFTAPKQAIGHVEVRSPANLNEILGVFPYSADDVEVAVGAARKAQRGWQSLRVEQRLEKLSQIEGALMPRWKELATIMQRELGRAVWECERELAGLVPRLHETCKLARTALLEGRGRAGVRLVPRALGVVAVISPVMFPLGTAHGALLAALVTGNTVVWKPSPLVAASAQIYAEVLAAAGLPPGVFNLIQGDDEVGARLAQADGLDGLVFIGNAENARAVRLAIAHRLDCKSVFHVGAKNAAVILADADVDVTVPEIVHGAFMTAGQRCTSLGRVLVDERVAESFIDVLLGVIDRLVLDPKSPRHASCGPMFSPARAARFVAQLGAAEAAGATFVRAATVADCHVSPSVCLLDDPEQPIALRTSELFGPNLVVEPIASLDDATTRLQRTQGLYASLFSTSARSWSRFCQSGDAGATLWNHSAHAVSGQVAFASSGREATSRGIGALLAMTRPSAWCEAATAARPEMPMHDVAPAVAKPKRASR